MKNEGVSLIFKTVFGPGLGASLPAMARAQEAPMPHGCSTRPAELRAEKKFVRMTQVCNIATHLPGRSGVLIISKYR